MKLSSLCVTSLVAIASTSSAFAFLNSKIPTTNKQQRQPLQMATSATGPQGKAASSYEEDLQWTLQIIMDHTERSTTVSKDQFIEQVKETKKLEESPPESIDVSIPYDAAAKLAYEATDKSVPYDAYKQAYEADAVEYVKSKQPIDVSIPYDAAAKLAYETSDKSMDLSLLSYANLAAAS